MTYEEYKKQRLAQNNTQSNVSNTTKINTAPVNRYEEYKKQRLAQNSFDSSKNIRKFNNILENGQKMKINMTPTQAIIEKGKQLYQEPNMLKNIKPEMSYAGDVIDKENISKNGNQNVAIGSIKSLGANALDATVDTLQYPKNAFKSEMKREERKDLELAIKLQNGFRGTKNQLTDEQANEFINYVKNKYNVSDFQNELNNINEWTYKENKLESATNELVSRVSEENSRLGKVGQRITNAFGSVGRMLPTIVANMVAPGTGMGTLYMSSAQSSQDEALRNGASYNDAAANGILSGALEVGTEAIGGERIAKLTGIPTLASKLGIRTGIIGDIVSEEIEEMISTTVQPFIDRITYNPNAPLATKEDYWNTFIDTALSTVLLMGVGEGINTVTEYRDKAISKVNESNMSVEQKQQSISEIEKGANELIDKVKNNAQNSTYNSDQTPKNQNSTQNNFKNDDMNVFDTERKYNTSSLPKNEEEVETNVRNRLNKEIEKDIEIFVENNTDDYQEIASSDVDYEIKDILRKMYTEEEIDYLYDTDLSSEVFNKISDIISNELEKHFYTFNSETEMYEPNIDKLGNSDEIRFKYDKLPSTDFEYKQLDNIRNMIDDLTWDMKKTLPDGIDITVDESRASADATYITVSNENTDETYEIRVGNHFKSGTSGNADEHIRISDFKTISKLKENLKEKIENGLIDVGGENRQNDTINEQKEKHDVDIIKESDYNNYEVERKKEPRNYIYKNITDEDKARVDSDYKLNKSKYIGKNFVHFDDVSYGYNIEDGEVKVTSKFKGSQKFIREVEEAWENGVDKLSNGNTKITESIRRIKRGGDTSNGISRKQSSSRESDRENIGNGRQQRGIDSTKTSENNGNNLKDSKQSSFSLSKDNQGRTLSREQQEYFKDSKVRDKVGRLSEVYHGTNIDFDIFNAKLSNFGQASSYLNFFTNKIDSYPDSAMDYARNAVQKKGGKERIIKAYLNIKKPYVFDSSEYYNSVSAYDRNYRKIQAEYLSGDYDGIIVKDFSGKNDDVLYAVENSNQIKSIDNTKPTSNPDIRYSQSNGEWSKYLKENWDLMPNSKKTFGFPTNEQLQVMDNKKISEGADVLNLKEKKIKSLEDIANMTENDARMENGVNYKHKKDKNTPYQRKFFENVETSKIINQEVKDTIEMTTYERQANEQTLENAKISLDEQGDKLIKQWERKTKNFTAEDVAIGAILIERYQQQGDNESAVNVVQKLADMGTEAGRAVQMFSIFQRLTPEAMLIYQQRKLNDVFKEISQRKTGEWVEANRDKFQLTSEDGKFITEQVEKAQQATSERQKQIELAKIEARINNKLPPDRGQTIKAIRRISMLFNPKTQVRNIVGNTLIMPINDVADIIGTQIDKAIAKRTGVRTTNNPIFKEKGKGFKKGITESIQDYKMGIRTEPSGSKYEFNFGGKSFNENTSSKALNVINNKLNGIENLLGAVMSGGDRPFYEAAFNNSLQGQMKANNVTTPTTEMIDIAVNEALSRTWNDSNSYTEAVLGIRRQMNKLNIGGFGLGDLIIPFAKTPANLTKAMVEYSPLGTIEAIINYSDMKKAISRGEMTAQQQKNFVNSTSKAITGSILYLIAGALAQSGAVTGSADDDKDVRNFEQNVLGIQPYSIKIGDKTFTYSWANPLNAPLAIMADTYKMGKEKAGLFDILTNGFKVAGEVVVDNSFLQGIKELFEADSISEGVVNAIVDMPAQFVPTFLSQFATLGDKTKRQTFEYGDKLKSTINQIKAKIPGAKNTLAPTVNTFGEEVENYGGDNSAFNVFLNPANISKANATDTQKELYALYEATKDKTIFPMQAPYYLSDDGEKVNLSNNERSEYQKRSGEYVSKELHALFDSEFYKTLENEDKVEVVNKIVKDANTHAKSKWITTKATKELKKIQEELKDVPMVDYYNAWLAQKDAEGKKNAKGETISGTKKKAKIKAINSAVDDDLTTYQKKALYRIFNVD